MVVGVSGLFSVIADINLLAGVTAAIVFVVLLSVFLTDRLRPRHGLVWHELLPQRPERGKGVAANLYLIENVGRLDAEDIEILLDRPPADIVLNPPIACGLGDVDGRARLVTIERLAPGGKLGLRLASRSGEPPSVVRVAWRKGPASAERPWWRRQAGKSP